MGNSSFFFMTSLPVWVGLFYVTVMAAPMTFRFKMTAPMNFRFSNGGAHELPVK